MTVQQRREWAYWLTLAFRLERESRRTINGLVLTADALDRVSESTDVYAPAPPDLVLAELDRAASKGASTREIEQATSVSTHRVRKRLKELLDAGLIAKSGNRYFKQAADTEASSVPERKPALRSKKSTVETTQALFSEMDLQAHRTRS